MKTAMQDLKEDLIKSISTSKIAIQNINDAYTRQCCFESIEITLNTIIKRIDDELLESEKQQIINAYNTATKVKYNQEIVKLGISTQPIGIENSKQYYNETFNKKPAAEKD